MNNVETLLNRMPRFPRGVPCINFGPPDRDHDQLLQEFSRTHTAFLEAHLANGEVLARQADQLRELQGEVALREVDARLIGLTADNQRKCANRPPRNIYNYICADEVGTLAIANYQRRFLEPAHFEQCMLEHLARTLAPSDFTHRLPEIHAVLKKLPAGPAAQALQTFAQLAKVYGLDDLLSEGKVRGHFYENGKEPLPLGDEGAGIILLAPPAIAGEQGPASLVPLGPTAQLELGI